jgi:hypothetical protein
MNTYVVFSKRMRSWDGVTMGAFDSFDLASNAVQEWCENHNDHWEQFQENLFINQTERGQWWISIKEFESNQLSESEEMSLAKESIRQGSFEINPDRSRYGTVEVLCHVPFLAGERVSNKESEE